MMFWDKRREGEFLPRERPSQTYSTRPWTSRLIAHDLLLLPRGRISRGGQWDMYCAIADNLRLRCPSHVHARDVPVLEHPDAESSSSTLKLREDLEGPASPRYFAQGDASDVNMDVSSRDMLTRMIFTSACSSMSLGTADRPKFTFECRDKDKRVIHLLKQDILARTELLR